MNVKSRCGRMARGAALMVAIGLLVSATASAHAVSARPCRLPASWSSTACGRADREGGLDNQHDRADGPGRVRDRLVRAPAAGLAHEAAADRLRRQRRGHQGDLDRRLTPTGQDSLFQFLAQPASAKAYTFQVEQTYSDGSIVNWSGADSSEDPAPTIEAADSLGGGSGVSVLTIIALVVGVLGLLAGAFALLGGSKERSLA